MANNTAWAIDRVRRVVGFGSDSSAFLNLTQLEGVTIKATTDKTEVVDALGSPIMELMRAKKVQIDGNSSLFDLNLLGAQMGSKVEVSSAENKFMVPCFETYTYSAGNGGTYALKHTIPTGKLGSGIQKYAYKIRTVVLRRSMSLTPRHLKTSLAWRLQAILPLLRLLLV